MNRTAAMFCKAAIAGVSHLTAVAATGCGGEVAVAEPAYYPPAAYVASTAPVYYEGRPAYFYGDRWYYRDGGGWGYYRNEPEYLRGRRGLYVGVGVGYNRGYVYRGGRGYGGRGYRR